MLPYVVAAMRILLLGAAVLLHGCDTFPLTAEPRVLVSPYLAEYRLRGDIAMQNDPGTGPQDNAPQSLNQFGFGHHEDDIGIRTDVGDGFAGIRFDYYQLSMNTSHTGVLNDDFGHLLAGDVVRMSASMDEWRLGWTQHVFREKYSIQNQPLEVHAGLGGVYAHRDLGMHMRTNDGTRTQDLRHTGDAFYASGRLRAELKNVAFDVDYAISPDLVTGDFDGVQQDFEARLAYTVPFQDVTLYGGYRYSTWHAEGHEGGLAFDSDLVLDGWQFGVTVSF